MAAGLVKGEGFAVDASVMEANASRYYGKAPDELDWSDAQRQKRAVAEYLAGLEAEAPVQEGGDGRGGGPDGEPTPKPDQQAAEGDLAFRSVIGVDGQSQQARAVRIWAQLSYRRRARDHRRCRANAGTHL